MWRKGLVLTMKHTWWLSRVEEDIDRCEGKAGLGVTPSKRGECNITSSRIYLLLFVKNRVRRRRFWKTRHRRRKQPGDPNRLMDCHLQINTSHMRYICPNCPGRRLLYFLRCAKNGRKFEHMACLDTGIDAATTLSTTPDS